MAEIEDSFFTTLLPSPTPRTKKNFFRDDDDLYSQLVADWVRDEDHHRPNIVDIDAADVDNELAAVDYVKDMYSFYDFTENAGRVDDYMSRQTREIINYESRALLVNWLIRLHEELELMPEVLYLSVNIFDRFLSAVSVPSRRVLDLVAITSMLIACKYEQDQWTPRVSGFIEKSDYRYFAEEVVCMESEILGKLEWNLSVPTPYVYLVRFIKASIPDDDEVMENVAFFYAELGLTDYWSVISYRPSMLAASAVYAARCTLKRSPFWTETLEHYTGYSEDQLERCARLLVGFHTSNFGGKNKLLEAVSRKYKKSERGDVAFVPPAINLQICPDYT